MKKFLNILPFLAAYFFVFLFCYASISKILDFENFQVQIAQSPLLSAYAGFISYAVIIGELAISLLLLITKSRLIGLYLSLGIMVSFTVYIFLILNYSDFVPCSCGGILEKMGWTQHLVFNVCCVFFAMLGIFMRQENQKRYRIITGIISITLVSAAVVIVLFLSSENIIKKENNFTRRFLLHPIIEDKRLDLGLNSYYFAGVDNGKIYLGNITAPLIMTSVDTSLKVFSKTMISLDRSDHKFRNLQLQVKAKYYYLYDGSVPIIYRGLLRDSSAKTITFKEAYFNQVLVIDSAKFAIRTQNSVNREYVLASFDLDRTPKVKLYTDLLEKQIDGVFDSDGKLVKAYGTNQLIYTYLYRNEYIVMNDGLDLSKRLNTIDTTKAAKISVTKLSDGKRKMSAPPQTVNKNQTANGTLLFNQSNLMGRYESAESWGKSSVVDVYRINKQEYVGSFYVYNKNGNKMSHMFATEKYLFVLMGNEIVRYRFRVPL